MTLKSKLQTLSVCCAIVLSLISLNRCSSGDDGGGSSSNPPNTPPNSGSTAHVGYEANWHSGNVSTFAVNTDSTLTILGTPIAAGMHPHSINVDRGGRFVYVSNHESNFLSGYTVNSTTGALTPVAGGPLNVGDSPHASVFDRSGRFLYVVNGVPGTTPTSMITAYIVNANGSLTPIGSAFPTGQHSHNLTLDPSNRFIYVASDESNETYAFSINATTGALTPIPGSPYPGVSGPLAVAVDQATKFAYVSNTGGEVEAFSIDPTSGALSELAPTHVFPGGGQYAHSIVFDSSQNFLYTGNVNSHNVSAFEVNHTTGALTPVAGSPFPSGQQPEYLTAHPTAGFLYVSNFGQDNILRFSINPTTGQLTEAGTFSDPAVSTGAVDGPIALGVVGW